MIKKQPLFTLAISLLPFLTQAQQNEPGIHFERLPNWNAVVAKAKQEHKYIFVDCYATWCGPCKTMDAEVYPNKEVGEVYNKDFISVKLQMDKTTNDDEQTKRWYKTAKTFNENYSISSLPTFLFFDENGNPLHKV